MKAGPLLIKEVLKFGKGRMDGEILLARNGTMKSAHLWKSGTAPGDNMVGTTVETMDGMGAEEVGMDDGTMDTEKIADRPRDGGRPSREAPRVILK